MKSSDSIADVAQPRDRRSPKGQGLLQKEGSPSPIQIRYFVAKLCIVVIYVLFERVSHLAFVELSTKVILLS